MDGKHFGLVKSESAKVQSDTDKNIKEYGVKIGF